MPAVLEPEIISARNRSRWQAEQARRALGQLLAMGLGASYFDVPAHHPGFHQPIPAHDRQRFARVPSPRRSITLRPGALAERRQAAGLTQRELGTWVQRHPSLVNLWEQGRRPVPADAWPRLLSALDCLPADLLPTGAKAPRGKGLPKCGRCGTCPHCRAVATKRKRYAEGWRPKMTPRHDEWGEAEKRRLTELAGKLTAEEIAAVLTTEFGQRRTRAAVVHRACAIGVSVYLEAYSLNEVTRLLGVNDDAIARWVKQGVLRATRWGTRGIGGLGSYRFEQEALEAFLRHCTWAYDWRRVQAGRWRDLAEVAHRADPWVSLDEAGRYLGLGRTALRKFRTSGLLPTRRRSAAPDSPRHVVRAAELPAYAAAIERALSPASLGRLAAARRRRDEMRRAA